jgi:uncharacterized protein
MDTIASKARRIMNRLEQLRQVIDEIVRKNPDPEQCRCGFVHLYGVSDTCTILALKRSLDAELCAVMGMLHDIWNYQFGENPEHANLGVVEARKILQRLGSFSPVEVDTICTAISLHSDKQSINGEIAELLKDADAFHHFLYNPAMYVEAVQNPADTRKKSGHILHLKSVFSELGIKLDLD